MTIDRERIAKFEADRWEQERWERGREDHINRQKARVSSLLSQRIEAYEFAKSLLEKIEQVYADACLEAGESMGGTRLAKALSAMGVRTRKNVDPTKLKDKGKAWADDLRQSDWGMVKLVVEECRTWMTVRTMSADFEAATLGEVEARYLEIIADIMALGRQLRNEPPLIRVEILARAKVQAIIEAHNQRKEKPPVTMAAREGYWRDREPPLRKIFES